MRRHRRWPGLRQLLGRVLGATKRAAIHHHRVFNTLVGLLQLGFQQLQLADLRVSRRSMNSPGVGKGQAIESACSGLPATA